MDSNIRKSAESVFKAVISLEQELLAQMKDGFETEEELLQWSEDLGKMKILIDNVRELIEIDFYNNL